LVLGITGSSHNPWTPNIVSVRKKNEKLRMCVDYRQLNNNNKKDRYALPRIVELLYSLAGNTFFITVDMNNDYHQVEILKQNLL
jgi:hypothetical protein